MTRPIKLSKSTTTRSIEYQRALEYLYRRINYEKLGSSNAAEYRFRLQRMRELLKSLGLSKYIDYPELDAAVPLIHVAGTKGKGSVASMIASALTTAGYRTGLYTSPHLVDLAERFQVNHSTCSEITFAQLVKRVREAAESIEPEHGSSTFFELTTAMAILHFEIERCDFIVAEVGLGGRLDSTNVLSPSVSVITSIGLDHQHVLGHDLVSIAKEKAGIIKPGVPVVSGVEQLETQLVIHSHAESNSSELFQLGSEFQYSSTRRPVWGSDITFRGLKSPLPNDLTFQVAMEGEHQARNAVIATAALSLLTEDHFHRHHDPSGDNDQPKQNQGDLLNEGLRPALANLQCAARLERREHDHHVVSIVDSSHNEDSIEALVSCLKQRCIDKPIYAVFGTSQDKAAGKMLQILDEVPLRLILTQYQNNPRYFPIEQLIGLTSPQQRESLMIADNPVEACEKAWQLASETGGTVVVCGSFFLAAETRQWIHSHP